MDPSNEKNLKKTDLAVSRHWPALQAGVDLKQQSLFF